MTGLRAVGRRARHDWRSWTLVAAGLLGFVGLTYLAVVVGGGVLIGHTTTPNLGLSVLATALVAVGFDPVLVRLQAWAANRAGRPSPYEVLRRFSTAVAESGPGDDVPQRMARLIAEGTGAEWAQVRTTVDGRPVSIATWPPETAIRPARSAEQDRGTRQLPVRHGAEQLGLLILRERSGTPLTPVEERLFTSLAGQAGLVLRGARLRATLQQRLAELSAREKELRESRGRLVDAQDAARRRLERDIHDGAQQHLVALAVNLRLAAGLRATDPRRADALLAGQQRAAEDATTVLVQLARGIYPPLLAESGVAAALRAIAAEGVQVVERGRCRFPRDIEAAAYFCCSEALQNAQKHGDPTTVRVEVDGRDDRLTVTVTDAGVGFDPARVVVGTGLAGMRDRVDSAGGSWEIHAAPGRGTRVVAVFPLPAAATTRVGG